MEQISPYYGSLRVGPARRQAAIVQYSGSTFENVGMGFFDSSNGSPDRRRHRFGTPRLFIADIAMGGAP